jgi:death on curing protein
VKEPLWIDREDALAIHDMMLAQHGGLAGIRDSGLLESSLGRPRHLLVYYKPTLHDLAAAYAYAIVQDHPFMDGNKRTGFMVAATFLEVNGVELTASETEMVGAILALADRKLSEKKIATWLRANSRSAP